MSRRSTHRRELGSTGDNLELNHDPSHPFQVNLFELCLRFLAGSTLGVLPTMNEGRGLMKAVGKLLGRKHESSSHFLAQGPESSVFDFLPLLMSFDP